MRDKYSRNFIYPSITVCPEKTFKTSEVIPVHGTIKEIKQFYLGATVIEIYLSPSEIALEFYLINAPKYVLSF